ncbi:MAG: helicase-related protein, partial [Pirellulaceae bacterium]
GHARDLDLGLELPAEELAAVCSNDHWGQVYERLTTLIQSHRSTLVFVNTRRMAERVAHRLTEQLGADAVASHHGSLSRDIRLDAEQRLKSGQLKAIVATASLEMGIDIGYIDLVCQIGSPRSIATFLQRVGRSGHAVGALPKGRLFPLTRDELLECLALVRSVRRGILDRIEIPEAPLDILAQQIVAAVACEEYDETALFDLCRRAGPYRNLSRADFDAVVTMLADGIKPGSKAGAYLHRDQINGRLRARRSARLAAITSGGAIPERGEYRVLIEGEGTLVGTVDEDFAIDSMVGNIFLLGNTSWRIRQITSSEVIVSDAHGAPPNIPFWFGEAPGRTIELSQELSSLRRDLAQRLISNDSTLPAPHSALPSSLQPPPPHPPPQTNRP